MFLCAYLQANCREVLDFIAKSHARYVWLGDIWYTLCFYNFADGTMPSPQYLVFFRGLSCWLFFGKLAAKAEEAFAPKEKTASPFTFQKKEIAFCVKHFLG
jgi:hypothetical protein